MDFDYDELEKVFARLSEPKEQKPVVMSSTTVDPLYANAFAPEVLQAAEERRARTRAAVKAEAAVFQVITDALYEHHNLIQVFEREKDFHGEQYNWPPPRRVVAGLFGNLVGQFLTERYKGDAETIHCLPRYKLYASFLPQKVNDASGDAIPVPGISIGINLHNDCYRRQGGCRKLAAMHHLPPPTVVVQRELKGGISWRLDERLDVGRYAELQHLLGKLLNPMHCADDGEMFDDELVLPRMPRVQGKPDLVSIEPGVVNYAELKRACQAAIAQQSPTG